MSSMDAGASIETPLLCGAGLARTKKYLEENGSLIALKALKAVEQAEAHSRPESFDREAILGEAERYFGGISHEL